MNPAICCPRCGRYNASRARFCGNCGLSFLAAGVLPSREASPPRRSGGGFLGVMTGLLVVFLLVAALSFVRVTSPQRVHLGPAFCPRALQQPAVRIHSDGSEDVPSWRRPHLQQRTFWRYENGRGTCVYVDGTGGG